MLRFEANTSSFEKGMVSLNKTAEKTAKSALEYADSYIGESAWAKAPVHVEGYHFQGGFFPGGTLQGSFAVVEKSIGSYKMSSVYRMSGEKNPVAQGVDYARYQEHMFMGEHSVGESPYLEPSVDEGGLEVLEFIANDLHLYFK